MFEKPENSPINGIPQEDGQYGMNFPEKKQYDFESENNTVESKPLFLEDVDGWQEKLLKYQMAQDIQSYLKKVGSMQEDAKAQGRPAPEMTPEEAQAFAEAWNNRYDAVVAKADGNVLRFPGTPRTEEYKDILNEKTGKPFEMRGQNAA
jgi:hypothetical protein